MPNNYDHCGNCPFNPQSNTKSQNLNYIQKLNTHPLSLENNNSNVLLVFESPGYNEWINNSPIFYQPTAKTSAGYIFRQALIATNKKRIDYDITEAVQCFPGCSATGNSTSNIKIQGETEIASLFCLKYLYQDIIAKNYKKIVCFGNIAYNSTSHIIRMLTNHPHYNNSFLINNVFRLVHPSVSKTLINDISMYL